MCGSNRITDCLYARRRAQEHEIDDGRNPRKSPLLKELETKGSIKIVGAMYGLDTAVVELFS